MRYQLGVEDIEPDHWVAWVFDIPGCYGSARSREEAVDATPAQIATEFTWHARASCVPLRACDAIDVEVAKVFQSFVVEDDYRVNAFFADDRRPLTYGEVEDGLRRPDRSRRELLSRVTPISPALLHRSGVGHADGSIAAILRHVAQAEWWYFDRLDLAFDRAATTSDPLAMLDAVRAHTRNQLPKLVGDERVIEQTAELWSARKVLRRTLWHEQDHSQHIATLLSPNA